MSIKQEEYKEYLMSPYWIKLRKRVLDSPYYGRPRECFVCLSTTDLIVHHMTYLRKGYERDDDLVILCDKCHRLVHTNKNGTHTLERIFITVFELKQEVLGISFDHSREARRLRKLSRTQEKYENRTYSFKKRKPKNKPINYVGRPQNTESLKYVGAFEFYAKQRKKLE